MLRRSHRGGERQPTADHDEDARPGAEGTGDPESSGGLVSRDPASGRSEGPWDAQDDYPARERIDCGSLLVPVREEFDVQINVTTDQGMWIVVVSGESGLQLQAFAAPRGGGLWDDVRGEIAANITAVGGDCEEQPGRFGTELRARVPADEEDPAAGLQPVRFLGCDGPRWFLRGALNGPAATDRELAGPLEQFFADTVVVRGDYPAPPRQPLEIRLPEETRQALETQFEQENPDWELPNPFARGPEITRIG